MLEDVERHPVLDAAREVDLFRFGVEGPRLAAVTEIDPEKGGISDHAPEPF
jgi:hypothetical protein